MSAIAEATEVKTEAQPLTPHDLIQVGDGVYWYGGGNKSDNPQFGWVSKKNIETLAIHITKPTSYAFGFKEGVLHVDDPRVHRDERAGGWDFAPRTKQLIEQQQMLLELQARLLEVEDAVTK